MADVQITVAAATAQAKENIDNLSKAVGGIQAPAEKSGISFGQMMGAVGLGNIVGQTAIGIFQDVTGWFGKAADAAAEAERADTGLSSALSITGRDVVSLSQSLGDQALAYQKTTIYTDEQIKSAETLLVQMTKLDSQGLSQATKGTIGLASALHMDLNSAAMAVEKAMNGNYMMLQRWGITVKDAGSAAEKKTEILDQLGKMYGRAESDAKTFGGQLEIEKHQLEEVQETIGKKMLPIKLALAKAITDLAEALFMQNEAQSIADKAGERSAEAQDKVIQRIRLAADAAGISGTAFEKLTLAYHGNWTAMEMAIDAGKVEGITREGLRAVIDKQLGSYEAASAAQKKAHDDSLRSVDDIGKVMKAETDLSAEIAKASMTGVTLARWEAENRYLVKSAEIKKEFNDEQVQSKLIAGEAQLRDAKLLQIDAKFRADLLVNESKQESEEKKRIKAIDLAWAKSMLDRGTEVRKVENDIAQFHKTGLASELANIETERLATMAALASKFLETGVTDTKLKALYEDFYKAKKQAAIDDSSGLTEITQTTIDDMTTLYGNFSKDTLVAFENWGAGTEGLLKGVGDAFMNLGQSAIKMAEDILVSIIEKEAKAFLMTQMNAVANVIKSVMAWPFPANILMVGGAIATVDLLFSKIKKFDEGGIVPGQMLGMLHPNEAIIPLKKLPEMVQQINHNSTNYYGGQGQQRPAPIYVQVILDGQELKKHTVKTVKYALDTRQLTVPGGAIG